MSPSQEGSRGKPEWKRTLLADSLFERREHLSQTVSHSTSQSRVSSEVSRQKGFSRASAAASPQVCVYFIVNCLSPTMLQWPGSISDTCVSVCWGKRTDVAVGNVSSVVRFGADGPVCMTSATAGQNETHDMHPILHCWFRLSLSLSLSISSLPLPLRSPSSSHSFSLFCLCACRAERQNT